MPKSSMERCVRVFVVLLGMLHISFGEFTKDFV